MRKSMWNLHLLLSFALLFYLGYAACPNACSGHGSCGQHDSCICHSNWQGGDCSERVCMHNWAWVAGPNGDVNFDGTLYGSTQYADGYRFTAAASYLATDAMPGGSWEYWPSFHSTTTDEGHFYMECSNRGLCNRDTGLCQCFPGYEGTGCSRSSCPNDCSGNGVCLTVNQLLADDNAATGGSRVYSLWDGDMSRSCKCDPGFTGPDCSDKVCPHGDDPLTTDYQIDEVQWVDIYSTYASAITTGLDGTATFTYTDVYGETWTTDPVNVQYYDSSTAANQVASDLESALESLPNNVLPDVTVTAGYCETLLPGNFKGFDAAAADANGYAGNSGANPASGYLRCPLASSSSTGEQGHLVVNVDKTIYINSYAGSGDPTYDSSALAATVDATGAVDSTCYLIVNPECIRLKIEFPQNSGSLSDISVDISGVTLDGKTNAQDAMLIAATVTDELVLTDNTATFGYFYTPDETVTSSDDQGTITSGTKTITFGTASPGTGVEFVKNTKIALYCTTSGPTVSHYLGEYTVSASAADGADVVTVEVISNPHSLCAVAGEGTVSVSKVTHYVDTNVDLTNENLVGYSVEFTNFISASQMVKRTVESVQYLADNDGHILFGPKSSLTADVVSGAGQLKIYGKGTKENSECGDRGLCNRDSGLCECFVGYTGPSCGLQDALAS